jgi:nucleoid-associated protein YgaU
MGLISFFKDAGEKLLGIGKAKAAQEAAVQAPTAENLSQLSKAAGEAIATYIGTQNLAVSGLDVTVAGVVPDQATREKVVLCCGNVGGVAAVNDLLVVKTPEPESQFYTVVKGDNLSKISKQFYGDPNKYMKIFEANKPMLTHPDKIYPGQLLRIPPQV